MDYISEAEALSDIYDGCEIYSEPYTKKGKAFTSVEQSKDLAEILPLESADMKWFVPADNEGEFIEEVSLINNKSEYTLFEKVTDWNDTPYIPCWSLAALLDVLPEKYTELIKEGGMYRIIIKDSFMTCLFGNPIDACYEMIMRLHELNLL